MLRALRIGAWTGLGAALAGTVAHLSAAPALGWFLANGLLGLVATVSFGFAYKKAGRTGLAWGLVAVYLVGFGASRATQALLQADEVTQGLVAMAAYGGAIHFLVIPALAYLWFSPWDRQGWWTAPLVVATLTALVGAYYWWLVFRLYPVGSPEWLAAIEITGTWAGASYVLIAIVALAGVYNIQRNWPMALATLTQDQTSAEQREQSSLDQASDSTADRHELPTIRGDLTAERMRPPAVVRHPFDTATDQADQLYGTLEAQAASDAEVKRALTSRLARGEISEATFALALASLSDDNQD